MVLDILTWILIGVVLFYAGMMFIKTALPMMRYKKKKDSLIEVKGTIVSSYGDDVTEKNGVAVRSFYPVFECELDGQKYKLSGLVRYAGELQEYTEKEFDLLFDREAKELWCETDLPIMKKQLRTRVLIIMFLIALLIATSFLP